MLYDAKFPLQEFVSVIKPKLPVEEKQLADALNHILLKNPGLGPAVALSLVKEYIRTESLKQGILILFQLVAVFVCSSRSICTRPLLTEVKCLLGFSSFRFS